METKETIKVLLEFDADGWIISYQNEFWDGHDWGVTFDLNDPNVIDMTQTELDGIALRASKLVDGKVVVNQEKLAELQAAAAPQPTAEQQMIAALSLKIMALEKGGATGE
ncbi:phage infection protein [Lacticaseibacillus porcinae]|uniref:phage infection protein n=1 Tax=Lacticaseibacillus porcinae TaxID=1123687 RepID=UPI000F7AC473|nr:phage infection protein [Lacticaseibacillus porcinae]